MQKHHLFLVGSLLGLTALLLGCATPGSPAQSSSSCVNGSAPHTAYVVVQHASGKVVQRCVGFSGATIDGLTLMKKSGLEQQMQSYSFGDAICQLDNEPVQVPPSCFASTGSNWGEYVSTNGTAWTLGQTAFNQAVVDNGGALGWIFEGSNATTEPPLPKKAT